MSEFYKQNLPEKNIWVIYIKYQLKKGMPQGIKLKITKQKKILSNLKIKEGQKNQRKKGKEIGDFIGRDKGK